MQAPLSKALKRCAPLAIAFTVTALGCSMSPTDGHTVTNRSTPIEFEGYIPESEMMVTVNVEHPSTGALVPIVTPTSSDTGQMFDGIEWFRYSETTAIPNYLWSPGPSFGHFAKVRVTTPATYFSTLLSLGPDWVSCYLDNDNIADFISNCTSPNSPVAYVYTDDFLPNIDLVVEDINYNSGTQTASLAVQNVGRSGTIARIECFGLNSTIVAYPDVQIAPAETKTINQWIPTPSGHIVTCTVFGEGIEGDPESVICGGSPVVTCGENSGQMIAP